jgi:hypothetical protein
MGSATPSDDGTSASVDVMNDNGDLKGPNGDTQNGGGEGSCIEVQICWYYWTWDKRLSARFTSTGFEIVCRWVLVRKKACNGGGDVEVCPC